MLMIAPLTVRVLARLRRPLASLLILPCLSVPDFAVDGFHVEGKALRSWIHDLDRDSVLVKYNVCDVLGKQGERARAAVPALIAALDDEEWLVWVSVIRALGQIAPPADRIVSAVLLCLGR